MASLSTSSSSCSASVSSQGEMKEASSGAPHGNTEPTCKSYEIERSFDRCCEELFGPLKESRRSFLASSAMSADQGKEGELSLHSPLRRLIIHLRCCGFRCSAEELLQSAQVESLTATGALTCRTQLACSDAPPAKEHWDGLFSFQQYERWLVTGIQSLLQRSDEDHTANTRALAIEMRRVASGYSWRRVSEPCESAWKTLTGCLLLRAESEMHASMLASVWILYHQLLTPLVEDPECLSDLIPPSHGPLIELVLRTVLVKIRLLASLKSLPKVLCEPDALHACFLVLQFFQRLEYASADSFFAHVLGTLNDSPSRMAALADLASDIAPHLTATDPAADPRVDLVHQCAWLNVRLQSIIRSGHKRDASSAEDDAKEPLLEHKTAPLVERDKSTTSNFQLVTEQLTETIVAQVLKRLEAREEQRRESIIDIVLSTMEDRAQRILADADLKAYDLMATRITTMQRDFVEQLRSTLFSPAASPSSLPASSSSSSLSSSSSSISAPLSASVVPS